MRRILLAFASLSVLSCGSSSGGGDSGGGGTTTPPPSAPAITLSTSAANFSGAVGAANPAAQNIAITNGGTGTLSGITVGAVVYGSGQTTGWLTASAAGTTAPTTLTLTPSLGTLKPGTYTATVAITSAVSGITNSPQTVTATLVVTAGAPSQLVFTTQPTSPAGGTLSPVSVSIEDAAGNVVTTATTSISLTLSANAFGATMSGTTTVAAVAGVATFSNLAVNKTGANYTLNATAVGFSAVTSAVFNATVAAPTQLAFTVQPSAVVAGAAITPAVAVAVKDALGNTVTNSTANVTIAILANPASGVLSGTTTVAAVNGVATFSGLSINNAGTGYTLTTSSSGLTGITSSAFNVTTSANSVTLAVGQSTSFLTSPNFSAALSVPSGSQYLVAVVNTDPTYTQSEGFSLTGAFSTSASALRVPSAVSIPAQSPPSARLSTATYELTAGKGRPSFVAMRAMQQNHIAILDANRQIYARAGNPAGAWAAARAQSPAIRNAAISASVTQTIGAVNKIFVRNSFAATCSAVDSIGARTVAIGQHVVVLADTSLANWPQANRPDTSFYQTFANEYDQITYPHLINNIGNPLAYDASLNGLGKVTVVLTPTVNKIGALAGGGTVVAFVSSCDFFPNRSAAIGNGFSNQTEVFYHFIPSAASGFDVPTWEASLRATAAHESKHIVSYTDRIINNSLVSEEIWLEEGLAQVSSEIWERNFNQATFLGHATFAQTLGCEVDIASSGFTCDASNNKPLALYFSHLPFFFQYLQTEGTSNGEGLGLDTPANYGAGWTIGRWAIDQYAGGNEGAFIKSLINEPQLNGLANLSSHTGQSIPLLLAYWNVATAIFQTPTFTAADVRTTFPSFNFANIFQVGQVGWTCSGVRCGFLTNSGSPTYPVQPIAISTASAISKAVSAVPGTSASFFLLTAAGTGVETLNLLTPGGAALSTSSGLRVVILRTQ